jgi:uncharacterized protein
LKTTPLIHLFKTPYSHYVFDTNTNDLIKVDEDVYGALQDIIDERITEDKLPRPIQERIGELKEEGYLSSNRVQELEHPVTPTLEYYQAHKVRSITLQVTQQCNLRCAYCIYSETNNPGQRRHSNKRMTKETAKKCIDFLLAHSRDEDRISIGFYGGEPLLEFDLIKYTVEYAKERLFGKTLHFHITTNATLLKDEKLDFLIQENFTVLVSLDGGKEIQDRNRKFINGQGSFNIVMANIQEYIRRNDGVSPSINVVLAPGNSFLEYDSFFKQNPIFSSLSPSEMSDVYSPEKINVSSAFIEQRRYEIFILFLHALKRVKKEFVSPLEITFLQTIYTAIDELGISGFAPKTSHGGPCAPGTGRLLVDVDGNLFPCERVSETSACMKIGTLDSGFDQNNSYNLLNICHLTPECKDCWVIENCSICAHFADEDGALSATQIRLFCNKIKEGMESKFRVISLFKDIRSLYGYQVLEQGEQ